MQTFPVIILAIGLIGSSQLIEPVGAQQGYMQLNPHIKNATTDDIGTNKWPNPSITISDESVSVSWGKHHEHYKDLQPEQVASFLVSLPVSAWPYGRIIQVGEQGISSGGKQIERYRKRSMSVIKAAMKRLGVTVMPGPPSA